MIIKIIQRISLPYVILSVFLFVFIFFIPPFQKPDEPLHFERAFALASGQITCIYDSQHMRGYFRFPKNIQTFPEQMMSQSIIMKTEGKFPVALLKKSYPIDSNNSVDLMYNCTLPFIGYVPQSLGIVLTLPFNNVLISFYAARLFSTLFFLFTLYISLRLIPKSYRLIIIFCSFLPMVMQQVTAISYDCVSIALGLVFFALFVKLQKQKIVSIRELIYLCIVLLLFLFSKPGFYLFSLLLLYPLQRMPLPIVKKIIIGGLFFAGVLGIALYSLTLPI